MVLQDSSFTVPPCLSLCSRGSMWWYVKRHCRLNNQPRISCRVWQQLGLYVVHPIGTWGHHSACLQWLLIGGQVWLPGNQWDRGTKHMVRYISYVNHSVDTMLGASTGVIGYSHRMTSKADAQKHVFDIKHAHTPRAYSVTVTWTLSFSCLCVQLKNCFRSHFSVVMFENWHSVLPEPTLDFRFTSLLDFTLVCSAHHTKSWVLSGKRNHNGEVCLLSLKVLDLQADCSQREVNSSVGLSL